MPIIILAIESSCDETACAIVQDGNVVLSNVISSQVNIHQKFGGVVPEVASRKHIDNINAVIDAALIKAALSLDDIDAIAVTYGPGLVGALLVGVSTAKALAYSMNKPLIGVHHIEGHVYANFLCHNQINFPNICLIVSGGHTCIVKINKHGSYELLGTTRDDAAGEAFDKVARCINLSYPGGPKIDALSKIGNKHAIAFPRAKLDCPYDFSFSGLKSSVLNYVNKLNMQGLDINQADIAASFQSAVVDVLVDKTILAANNHKIETILLAGGVSSNSALRERFSLACKCEKFNLFFPSIDLCTDNAAMIAAAAFYKFKKGDFSDFKLNAMAQLSFNNYINDNKTY